MQEKESITSVGYVQTNLKASCRARDAKTVILGTDLSIRTSHSCQILIFLLITKYIDSFRSYGIFQVPSFCGVATRNHMPLPKKIRGAGFLNISTKTYHGLLTVIHSRHLGLKMKTSDNLLVFVS